MVRDLISDFIINIKNAGKAGRETITVPVSSKILNIIDVLAKENFIAKDQQKPKSGDRTMEVSLLYKDGVSAVHGVKRMSTNSKRIYFRSNDIKPIKNGYGVLIMTTPKGVMTGKEAKKANVGGEPLFMIW